MRKIFHNGVAYGGSTASEEMTLAEYLALSEEQKNDGTVRFITDMDDRIDFVHEQNKIPQINEVQDGHAVVVWFHEVGLEEKPVCVLPTTFISGGESAFRYSGAPDDNVRFTTKDNDYSALWIVADYGEPIVLNAFTVAPRKFNKHLQIYRAIFEASNNGSDWVLIGEPSKKGDEIPYGVWYTCAFDNDTPYRYYRLRTTVDPSTGYVNNSATYTLSGIGFFNSSGGDGAKVYTSVYYRKKNKLIKFVLSEP